MATKKTVKIELPDGALAGWPVLINALELASETTGLNTVFGGLIDQIRVQTDPKPDEPQGLGAVVLDRQGTRWVRTEGPPAKVDGFVWTSAFSTALPDRAETRTYADIDAVKVLTQGLA